MGWPFDEATWNNVEGAYYAALGSEMLWIALSVACSVVPLIIGALHENSAYRKIGE